MQKFRQNDSFNIQNSAFSRKNIVKIKILQPNFQFDDFFFVKTTNLTVILIIINECPSACRNLTTNFDITLLVAQVY